ncbi:glycosyltransferase family 4 protein [Arthrobacter sp. A2-55]|uniref:glycosyltransferase family 4 protein n=1 Tax=Arthrobacter sp. A2-55 TaxID=2897337 RepID=UPI0021CD93E2|nr:glycosyltransferase family 4 protein [Arthrobacter sp. A2-55]MCU6479908.1 glycosyltransferase family 4 protein [Arthrobacter sp. A2-55]
MNLHVRTLVQEKNFHRDAKGRARDWADKPEDAKYDQAVLRSKRVPFSRRPLNILVSLDEVRDMARSDVIVLTGWHDPIYWQILLVAKITRTATVGFYESILATHTHRRGMIARLRASFFRSLDSVVTPGVAATEAIVAMGVRRERIFEGFNAIDIEMFSKLNQGDAPSQEGGHSFLFVGRLISLKNVDLIIKAFARIANARDSLTIVGGGECLNMLENLVRELDLLDRVTFLGPIEYKHLPDELAKHSTLILASSTEVWGLVVNEALATGLHVVVSRNCGVASSVAHMHGVFITENDVEHVAQSMTLSRSSWNGRINKPDILKHPPKELADQFLLAFDSGLGLSKK